MKSNGIILRISRGKPLFRALLVCAACWCSILFGSCERHLGWGVLLWATEDPAVPSGTILPVYIKSNLNQVWVAGIPREYQTGDGENKFEIPLWQLAFLKTKGAAQKYAAAFAEYANTYAEILQDGLPIRDTPDNNARRVYRLKLGQIIKILSREEGVPAISTTGEPLPGDWVQVLTEDGTIGYCFSYRLKIFEHTGGVLAATPDTAEAAPDPDLEYVLSKTWSPEFYLTMISEQKINIDEFGKQWQFLPGQETGIARIYHPDVDKTFSYSGIRRTGNRAWRFEGASLQMSLQTDTTLAVQYSENKGALQTLLFVALPSTVPDIITQELGRRDALFEILYIQGPHFTSTNYGSLTFGAEGTFTWSDYDLLTPQVISPASRGSGTVDLGLFLDRSLADRYDGALSFRFDGEGEPGTAANFLYTLDALGLRLEYVPPGNVVDTTVTRRAVSPVIIYFYKTEN
ncbi:SH3 domain-containing protein [Treponema sp. TIM-1]|uniref:SH3 domain-containing protein n=1 Tax=Treponema sp. TIM-1 TaxID=2898417 RepID=UPI0039809D2F